LQAEIAAVTGDDAAMSMLGVGADFKEFQKLFAPRVAELASDVIEPLNQLDDNVARVEQELQELRSRQLDETTQRWNRYKAGYEQYLRPEPVMEEDESVGNDSEQTDVSAAEDSGSASETMAPAVGDDEAEGAGSPPAETSGPLDDSTTRDKGESSS
jgi:hypothetical protein